MYEGAGGPIPGCNQGLLDITHSPFGPICNAARKTHERLYAIAAGTIQPYDTPVKHLFPSS